MSTEKKNNTWIPQSEKSLIKAPTIEIVEKHCISSSDPERSTTLYLCRSPDWCNIIPVTEDGKVVFVKQFRVGADHDTLEIPGGVLDGKDEDIQAAALREMEEETGYSALPGAKCVSLGWNFPNPAMMNNRCHSFIVGPVKKMNSQNLDPGEIIEVIEVPIQDLPNLIKDGGITHALILNTFFLLSLREERVSDALLSGLNGFTGSSSR